MRATLVDVHLVSREVDIPEACPGCKTDLTYDKTTIAAWEHQDQKRYGSLDAASGHFEWDEDDQTLPEGGESFISYVGYYCASCDCPLAENDASEADVGELPAGAEHARYTLDLWWEALRENPKLRCSYETWVAQSMTLDGVGEKPEVDASG